MKNRTPDSCPSATVFKTVCSHERILPFFAENKGLEPILLFTQTCLANRHDKPIFDCFPYVGYKGLEPLLAVLQTECLPISNEYPICTGRWIRTISARSLSPLCLPFHHTCKIKKPLKIN